MIKYVDIIHRIEEQYQTIDIAINNHIAGFGPQSANTFLK